MLITFDFLSGGVSRFVDLEYAISGNERARPHILDDGNSNGSRVAVNVIDGEASFAIATINETIISKKSYIYFPSALTTFTNFSSSIASRRVEVLWSVYPS